MPNNKNLSPMIGKFVGAWSSSNWAGISDPNTSPRSPLDFNSQSATPSPSPRGLKNYQLGGVGLGIVVEMEKPGNVISSNKAVQSKSLIHPNPDPVLDEIDEDDLEEYTFVTCYGPNKSYSRVYRDESRCNGRNYNDRFAIFYIDSPRSEDAQHPPPNFLDSCHLCKKTLHGKDIYMYRGEKGFCSNECRDQQITMGNATRSNRA